MRIAIATAVRCGAVRWDDGGRGLFSVASICSVGFRCEEVFDDERGSCVSDPAEWVELAHVEWVILNSFI